VLKLAIVRVNEKTGAQKILLDVPLEEHLLAELRPRHILFRKRNLRRVAEALRVVEDALKQQTIRLP
jgi:hypothetical protein